jgi:hypothetical protein
MRGGGDGEGQISAFLSPTESVVQSERKMQVVIQVVREISLETTNQKPSVVGKKKGR